MPKVTLTGGGKTVEVPKEATAKEVLRALGIELHSNTVGAKLNGEVLDLHWPIRDDVLITPIEMSDTDPAALHILRHSSSHVMAHAIQDIFPEAKFTIGPATDTGFYYDIDLDHKITEEELEKIEKRAKEIILADLPFSRRELTKKEAIALMQKRKEPFKVELINGIPDPTVSFYTVGDFDDLCEGPHLPSSGPIKGFKILSIAGAYWRGDARNKQLQRVYGTSFFAEEALEKFLKNLEEAAKRDHRKLGKELDLFSFHEEAGAGFVHYHPHGAMLRHLIEERIQNEHLQRGYQLVATPHIVKIDLYKTSGHTEYYKQNMYFMEIDEQEYAVKPMNCPSHITIFKRKLWSYRELPARYFELGTVYRYEKSGVMHGLLRVRGFTQDDAHIFCREDQIQKETLSVLTFIEDVMKLFGFTYSLSLSTRPADFAGKKEVWDIAEEALHAALKAGGFSYTVDPASGAFYGPKIDVILRDALDRDWQGPTVQLDFNLPERFNLTYVGEDGAKHRLVMIHRAILGSIERFIGALIEHTGGDFPLWLAPVQVVILTISEKYSDYAKGVGEELRKAGFRVELDERSEKIGKKIRESEMQKTPFMVVVGEKEESENKVAVRGRHRVDLGTMDVAALCQRLRQELR